MDYCYVVQPSQLLLSVILVKTKRNIGFAPLGSRLSNENGNFACFLTGTPVRFLRQMLNSLTLNRRMNMSHTR